MPAPHLMCALNCHIKSVSSKASELADEMLQLCKLKVIFAIFSQILKYLREACMCHYSLDALAALGTISKKFYSN